jgi:hypothetical protein
VSDGFNIERLDEVIHGRVRLGVMAYLAGAGSADFGELKGHLSATDGNLSVHLRKLEQAGYVAIEKTFSVRKPLTTVRITDPGRTAFAAYLEALRGLLPPN